MGKAVWKSALRKGDLKTTREQLTSLQNFVACQCEPKLRRRSHDTCWTTLEESLEAFLLVDHLRAVTKTVVCSLALARFDLQTCLDNVAGCGKVRSGHTGDGTSSQHLDDTKLLLRALAKEVLLEMAVGREVDGGEGNYSCQRWLSEE